MVTRLAGRCLPGARQALRRIADGVDVITYLGDYFRRRLAAVIGERRSWYS